METKKRSRAVILPFPGDPFLFNYWMTFFDNVWGSEVDQLYVHLNSPIEADVKNYIGKRCAHSPHNVVLIISDVQKEHGKVIDETLEVVTEDYVMLAEDDGFVFKPGMVDLAFQNLENGSFDIVASKRGSCSLEILKAAQDRWGLQYGGYGDQGCNFWPCFFFSTRSLLLRTDRDFGARAWKQGERILPLRCVVDVPVVAGDTFVNTSLQLREMIPDNRIMYLNQYHGHPDDMDAYDTHRDLFDGNAHWCHIGSLSSGVGGVLIDEDGRSLARRLIDPPKNTGNKLPATPLSDFEKREWERRVQMWLTCWEKREPLEIAQFAELYRVAIDRIIVQYALSIKNIQRRQAAYRSIGL